MWRNPAGLRLLSNSCETLEEAWVLMTLPCGELGCMVGLPLPRLQQIGVPLLGNRMPPSGLAFSPRQLQGFGKGPLAHTRWRGLSTPRLELPPRGWKVLWQPPRSSGRAGAQASAFPPPPTSLRSSLPVFLSAASPRRCGADRTPSPGRVMVVETPGRSQLVSAGCVGTCQGCSQLLRRGLQTRGDMLPFASPPAPFLGKQISQIFISR